VDRMSWVGAAVAVIIAAGAGFWFAGRAPAPPPVVVDRGPLPTSTLTIHVAGAVGDPGLVTVPAGSRVADAIVAAGGALPGADLGSVNLAAPLADGQHLRIPAPDEGIETPSGGGLVRINVAGVEELQQLPGVGPVLAERILGYREQHGPFATVEDLLDVPGIGEGKLASLREAVLVP